MKVYGDTRSGNCYKIKLLAALLNINHEWVHVDVLAGATRTDEYLAMNPNGKIPLLELDDGRYLSESNAILNYLAEGSALLPEDAFARAKSLQWQFFEQYSHEPNIAVARFIALFLGMPEDKKADFKARQEGGHAALRIMEQQLTSTPFLVGEDLTVADIALYGYTHVAHEGGFDLSGYPGITAWLERITELPGHVGME